MEKLPLVLDLTGTFVFALSGALAGVKRKLDLFGVLVLSFAAATAGGIARDVLIGAIPPASVNDWRYLGVSLFAGVITFYFSPLIVRMSNAVLLFDAAGLALFAVAGASKALAYGLNPMMAVVLGMVTAIGAAWSAMCCWPKSRPCCVQSFMRLLLWQPPGSWSSGMGWA
jgi:uncharacterized membrane protein YeiH